MNKMRELNYCKCAVVCHGLSELQIASYIRSKLHLKLEIFSKDKGSSSIQITSILNYLKKFKSLKSFADEYGVEYKNKKLLNFKLFIIMDTDDCTEHERQNFINKSMFKSHPLYEYICPIYNSPRLEIVLNKASIMPRIIKDSEKGVYYLKTFPICKEPFSMNAFKDIETFKNKIEPVECTNMDTFVSYCLSLIE